AGSPLPRVSPPMNEQPGPAPARNGLDRVVQSCGPMVTGSPVQICRRRVSTSCRSLLAKGKGQRVIDGDLEGRYVGIRPISHFAGVVLGEFLNWSLKSRER